MNHLNEQLPKEDYNQYMRNPNEFLLNKINQTKAYINEECLSKEMFNFESKETVTVEQPKVEENNCLFNNLGINNYLIKHNNKSSSARKNLTPSMDNCRSVQCSCTSCRRGRPTGCKRSAG